MSKRNTEIMGFLKPPKNPSKIGLHKGVPFMSSHRPKNETSESLSNEFLEFFQMHIKLAKDPNETTP